MYVLRKGLYILLTSGTNIVSSNPVDGEVYLMQHYVIHKVCQ
jgi:hypothetical protein